MPLDDEYLPSGWLHKSNAELRYYKNSDDAHPAGIIELKSFHDIEEHNTSVFFGFKLVSETKGQFVPMLYAETKDEINLWIIRIKANLNRLSNCNHYCSPNYCSLHSHHFLTNNTTTSNVHYSVLDKWLDKLNLYDGSDNDSNHFSKQSSTATTNSSSNYSRSSSMGGNTSPLTSKHKPNESINTIDYNSSIYPETLFVGSNNNSNHGSSKRQNSTPVNNNHNNHRLRQNSMPISNANHSNHIIRGNTTTVNNNLHKKSISSSNDLSKISSLEAEKAKYTENTSQNYQHPHIHRSISKFRSELWISLSPPPPRR